MDSVGYKSLKKMFNAALLLSSSVTARSSLLLEINSWTLLHKVKLLTLILVPNIISCSPALSFQKVQKSLFALQMIFGHQYLFFPLPQIVLEFLTDQT